MLKKLYDWLAGWLPVTMWLVYGPPGSGPWFETPKQAAEFIEEESQMDYKEWPDEGKPAVVVFPQSDIDALNAGTISFAEWHDWGIERTTVRKRELSREWSGW